MVKKTKEELIQEQNELLRELIAGIEDVRQGRVKPFK